MTQQNPHLDNRSCPMPIDDVCGNSRWSFSEARYVYIDLGMQTRSRGRALLAGASTRFPNTPRSLTVRGAHLCAVANEVVLLLLFLLLRLLRPSRARPFERKRIPEERRHRSLRPRLHSMWLLFVLFGESVVMRNEGLPAALAGGRAGGLTLLSGPLPNASRRCGLGTSGTRVSDALLTG